MMKSYAQELFEEGYREGYKQGYAEALCERILRHGELRFGRPAPSQLRQLTSVTDLPKTPQAPGTSASPVELERLLQKAAARGRRRAQARR